MGGGGGYKTGGGGGLKLYPYKKGDRKGFGPAIFDCDAEGLVPM